MKNKYILPFILLVFTLVAFSYVKSVYAFAADNWGYVLGDWMINYQAGFTRRGLSGTFIIWLSDLIDQLPTYTAVWIQSISFTCFLVLLFFLLRKRKINFWLLVVLLSPGTLLFSFYDHYAAGRKEIFLFIIFSAFLLCIQKQLFRYRFVTFLFCCACVMATLSHELFFFYSPYFLFAAYFYNSKYFPTSVLLFSLVIITTLCIYSWGIHVNGELICADLLKRGLPPLICQGGLSWPEDFGINDVKRFVGQTNYLPLYSTFLVLGLLPLVLFFQKIRQRILHQKRFYAGLFFLFLFLFSTPLFMLAVDWGRWLNIHFMLLMLTGIALMENQTDEWRNTRIDVPLFPGGLNPAFKKAIVAGITIAYLLLWQMPHWTAHFLYDRDANLQAFRMFFGI